MASHWKKRIPDRKYIIDSGSFVTLRIDTMIRIK